MLKVKLPVLGKISGNPHEAVNIGKSIELQNEARENSRKVNDASNAIEYMISELITDALFEDKKKALFFRSHIIETDFFTLNAKRKVLLAIISEKKLLVGTEKSKFEKDLSDFIKCRNSHVHGILSGNDSEVFLNYFEGGKKNQLLDDAYWERIQTLFVNLDNQIRQFSLKVKRENEDMA